MNYLTHRSSGGMKYGNGEKGADGFTAKVEGVSKTVGEVAGTLHRSFNEAKRAGLAEIKRSRSNEWNVAG